MLARPEPVETETTFGAFLQRRGLAADLGAAVQAHRGDDGEVEQAWRAGVMPSSELATAAAEFYGLPTSSFAAVSSGSPLLQGLSRRFLRDAFAWPFDDGGVTSLALADPSRRDAIHAIELALGRSLDLVVLSFDDIELLFERGEAADPATPDGDSGIVAGELDVPDTVEALQDLARGAPIVRSIDQILERALEVGATDIHLETGREHLRVRIRVDGHLRQEKLLPRHLAPAVLSRVKILAGLDIAERRLPQDGRATISVSGIEADLRVAIMPTMYGETAVLRILVKDTRLLDFNRIGMSGKDQASLRALLEDPHGIVIVTGPTGSGKTTTLAAAIQTLNNPARKIVTVEDPIEYQIPGVHQTQIKPAIGLTFATALRSFLRHDPDVIMVGEMRDQETARIGVQAALTGHLVLTTLHTNSATDSVIRLIDMGVEPYLIASSLRGALGQRLVRRLCERCSEPSPRDRDTARRLCAERGLPVDVDASFLAPVGCEACGRSGYRGRVGIFEVLHVTDRIRDMVRQNADARVITDAARSVGMTTMLEDGLAKAGRGLTSLAEVLRATG